MHVEAIGAAVDLRDPRLDERDELVIEPAHPEVVLDAHQGCDAGRNDGERISLFVSSFQLRLIFKCRRGRLHQRGLRLFVPSHLRQRAVDRFAELFENEIGGEPAHDFEHIA